MRRIITYGTFDLLHIGHINILRRAKALGDFLVVGLSTDEFNIKKHKHSFTSYQDRKKILESIRFVDLIIPEASWEQKIYDVQQYDIEAFAMGSDWRGEFDFLKEYCEVHYFERTAGISTTFIKSVLTE